MEKSTKILIFSTAYYPFVGGAEVAIKEITDRISDIDFDLITARLDSKLPKFEKIGNINVYRVGFGLPLIDKLLLPFWGAIETIKLNNKNNYSSYWCMMVTFASGAAYLANIFSKNKVPIVLTLQEGDSENHLEYGWFGLLGLSWRLALKQSSEVTAISTYLGERAKKLGYDKEVKIIPNGVDTSSYSQIFSDQELMGIYESIGENENVVILMSTSRLVKKNGLDLVIEAMKELPENFHFFNFGSGQEKSRLTKLALSLGVSHRVHLQEYIDHDELPKYLKIANIFVRPSRSEGMGNSFIEAMAARVPVIATPVGGILDFLKDGETGLFCEVDNPKSIADKVMQYINNPDLTSKIKENAYKMVVERYDWNLVAKQTKIYLIKK